MLATHHPSLRLEGEGNLLSGLHPGDPDLLGGAVLQAGDLLPLLLGVGPRVMSVLRPARHLSLAVLVLLEVVLPEKGGTEIAPVMTPVPQPTVPIAPLALLVITEVFC